MATPAARDLPLVILTGLSGAGKSTAMKVFEDLGFISVDGLPPDLIPELAALFLRQEEAHFRGLALGCDVRHSGFLAKLDRAMEDLAALRTTPRIVFIEARRAVLARRYAATRRPHPLEDASIGLDRALDMERELLTGIRDRAELVIDTSDYSIHDLRRAIQEKWEFIRSVRQGLRVFLLSFGYKHGPPSEADLLFDLRFLPNPYFEDALRPLTGRDAAVAGYVFGSESGREFHKRLTTFVRYILPLYAAEGRYRLTIGLGCTGGRHRSVAVAEALFDSLRQEGYAVSLEHRHIELG